MSKTFETKKLLDELTKIAQNALTEGHHFKTLSDEELKHRTTAESWNILECLEHLNLYGDFYLIEIEKRIMASKQHSSNILFKSGLLGNYFAELMKADNGKMKKMKSPQDKNPVLIKPGPNSIDRFIRQTESLLHLLELARQSDLSRIRCSISISKFIKLKLGDTLRFYVYHIERHIRQAKKVELGILQKLY